MAEEIIQMKDVQVGDRIRIHEGFVIDVLRVEGNMALVFPWGEGEDSFADIMTRELTRITPDVEPDDPAEEAQTQMLSSE